MITEEQLKEAYDRATALGSSSPEGREAWSGYWGLLGQRRTELAVIRGEFLPVVVAPQFEDALQRVIDEFDRREELRAKVDGIVVNLALSDKECTEGGVRVVTFGSEINDL